MPTLDTSKWQQSTRVETLNKFFPHRFQRSWINRYVYVNQVCLLPSLDSSHFPFSTSRSIIISIISLVAARLRERAVVHPFWVWGWWRRKLKKFFVFDSELGAVSEISPNKSQDEGKKPVEKFWFKIQIFTSQISVLVHQRFTNIIFHFI